MCDERTVADDLEYLSSNEITTQVRHFVIWSSCKLLTSVRRGKAVPPSRCETCPAKGRSSRKQSERFMEVTTWIEALRCQRTVLDGSASAQAVM